MHACREAIEKLEIGLESITYGEGEAHPGVILLQATMINSSQTTG